MDVVPDTPPAEIPATPDAQPQPDATGVVPAKTAIADPEILSHFRAEIAAAERHRRSFHGEWRRNVELRLGRTGSIYTGGVGGDIVDRTEVNPDWSLTKTKTANLYSQVPTVQVTHENKTYEAAIPPFAKALNYELGEKRCNVGVAMEEILNDVVNASGVAAALVDYSARFQTTTVPKLDQHAQQFAQLTPEKQDYVRQQKLVPMQAVTTPSDYRFSVTRLSPTDLLWPASFVGSNFDAAPWVGYKGRMSWAEAKTEFKLNDAIKDKVVTGGEIQPEDNLREYPEHQQSVEFQTVRHKTLFYWRYRIDPDEPSFCAIYKLVFLEGLPDPVIHAPWTGQKVDPTSNKYVGSTKFPLRFFTLTYITDNPVPPSDSSAGRPQVMDMRRSRKQMFENREHSKPLRWYDVNRIDPAIADNLQRGEWQAMIPTQGAGDKSIGEVARASYPAEDLAFDRQTKADLMELWQIGPDQTGAMSSSTTKGEAEIAQTNFATRIGQERGRVASGFLGIAEVLAGLMALYSDFPNLSDVEKQAMNQAWDFKTVLPDVVLKIRPDSTVLLDSQQRLQRLTQFLNMTAKSGYVNVMPVIVEIAELSGLDPADVVKQPQPPAPEEPNISYRFSGKDDLYSPVVMAMLMKSGQAPTPQELAAAKQLLLNAQIPEAVQPPPAQGGAPAAPPPPLAPSQLAPPVPAPDHPEWQLPDKVSKRSGDIGKGN